jgi:peptidoglycan/LPS O-acetylase OafA/YrhL
VVRSAAILLVLASHCGDSFATWRGDQAPWWLSVSGFFGVELFFVLSGFLIGRLLIRAIAAKPTMRAWGVFMLRRWMRTLPLYFIWLAFLLALWPPRFWEPGHWALASDYLLRYATLTQNLAWPMRDGWFGVSWSLTVEEWFYLGFSTALFGAVALLGRWVGFWTACALFLAVPAALRWQVPDSADFGEVLTKVAVLRLDAIAFGVLVAWAETRRSRLFRHPLPALACGVLLIASIWGGWFDRLVPLDPHVRRTFLFDIASLGFALCLPAAAALPRLPRVPGALALAISTQSYAIYLVHLSILEFAGYYRARWHIPVLGAATASLALIWVLSWASWRWIEAPILARRPRQPTSGEPAPSVVRVPTTPIYAGDGRSHADL